VFTQTSKQNKSLICGTVVIFGRKSIIWNTKHWCYRTMRTAYKIEKFFRSNGYSVTRSHEFKTRVKKLNIFFAPRWKDSSKEGRDSRRS